jgi:Cytochrome c554 and c-prime
MKKWIRLIFFLIASAFAVSLFLPTRDSFALSQDGKAQPTATPIPVTVCGQCHTDIVAKQPKTAMGNAMEKAADCRILKAHPSMQFKSEQFIYRIERRGEQSIYTVTDGYATISVPLLYGFGQGKSGQTYVFEYNGSYYESRVSFYRAIDGLDITLGYAKEKPTSVSEAIGRKLSMDETQRCFTCHTTGALDHKQLQVDRLQPGIGCTVCHGSADAHVAAFRAGDKNAPKLMKKLGAVDGDDMTQTVCGTCHRSVDDVIEMPNRAGDSNVRFQPYRIFNSRCYSADKRIGCTSCHDPHDNLAPESTFYDSKCLACHQSKPGADAMTTRMCKVGKRDCASCHMPKIEIPGAHFLFTDHRIRIARPGEPYPR